MQSAKAQSTIQTPTPGSKPVVKVLDEVQLKFLANREIQCQKTEASLKFTEDAYKSCLAAPPPKGEWWQDPKVVIGGVTVSFALGAVLGYIIVNESKK